MKRTALILLSAILLPALALQTYAASVLQDVEAGNDEVFIKIVTPVKYSVDVPRKKQKIIIDLEDTLYPLGLKTLEGKGNYLQQVRWSRRGDEDKKEARIVIDLKKPVDSKTYKIVESAEGLRVLLGEAEAKTAENTTEAKPAETADGLAEAPPAESAAETFVPVQTITPDFIVQPRDTTLAGKTVHLNIKGMPLNLILDAISKQTGASFVVEKGLEDRRFSAVFNKVSIRDALRALLEVNGLGYESVGNTNTYVVKELSRTRVRLSTRIFRLKNIQLYNMNRGSGSGDMASMSGTGSGGGLTASAMPNAQDDKSRVISGGFLDVLKEMVSKQGRIQVYPETNSLIISDLPENFSSIEEILDSLDTPVPQVMIEAYFVEINANNSRELGLEYGGTSGQLASFQGNSMLTGFPFTINGNVFPLDGKPGTYSPTWNDGVKDTIAIDQTATGVNYYNGVSVGVLSFRELTAVLKAIESTGDAQYLSKPKILTLNNKPAEIAVTADTVVEFETQLFTGPGYLGKQAVTPKRKDTGIRLWVTPQVNDGGTITLALAPVVARPENSTFFPTSNVVDTQKRYINTTIRVKDGSTVLIGGLMNNTESKTIRRVPLLGHIPIVGYLFSSVTKSNNKRELLIFITPKVVQ